MADREYLEKFRQLTSTQNTDQQCTTFLRAFVGDFHGNFEAVLDLAEEFKTFTPNPTSDRDLEQIIAHRFLEKRGETKTVCLSTPEVG